MQTIRRIMYMLLLRGLACLMLVIAPPYATANEIEEYLYMDLGFPEFTKYKIYIEGSSAAFDGVMHVAGRGHTCVPDDDLICLSLPGWFTFAFPKDTIQWENEDLTYRERSYSYKNYRFQITLAEKLDWHNSGETHLFYYIRSTRKRNQSDTEEVLVNSFIFSCEDGLQTITDYLRDDKGKVIDAEDEGHPINVMKPIGKAFGAGQCVSPIVIFDENK